MLTMPLCMAPPILAAFAHDKFPRFFRQRYRFFGSLLDLGEVDGECQLQMRTAQHDVDCVTCDGSQLSFVAKRTLEHHEAAGKRDDMEGCTSRIAMKLASRRAIAKRILNQFDQAREQACECLASIFVKSSALD